MEKELNKDIIIRKDKLRSARKFAVKRFLNNIKKEQENEKEDTFECCNTILSEKVSALQHIHKAHFPILQEYISHIIQTNEIKERITGKSDLYSEPSSLFKTRRNLKGHSDSISLSCDCNPSNGLVIIFYKYGYLENPNELARDQHTLVSRLNLTCKIRISKEGINATLAGETKDIEEYMSVTSQLDLIKDSICFDPLSEMEDSVRAFFKPSMGCRHCFNDISIKVVDEICPFGVHNVKMRHSGKEPSTEDIYPPFQALSPPEFHLMLLNHLENEKDFICLDVRNYYESLIGKFKSAVTPQIRKVCLILYTFRL